MQDYRFTVSIPVRFGDMDAMGHVNNAVYLTYLETARIAYYLMLMGQHDISQFSIILAEITVTYRSPATFGETLIVGIRVEEIRSRSFTTSYRVEDQASGRLIATSHSVQVAYDYANQKTMLAPPEFIEAAENYEGRPLRVKHD